MKVLLTGGHLTPCLAVIEHLQKEQPDWQLVFVGREFSREDTEQPSSEREEVTARGVSFLPITTGKFSSSSPLALLTAIGRTVVGFFTALQIILKERPDVCVSFGSYLAVPIAYAAWLSGVPVITHEQTRTIGMATRLISWVATTVAVSFPETAVAVSAKKVQITGNPLRTQLHRPPKTAPKWFTDASKKPIVYITGGSQGSEVLNTTVSQAVAKLTKDWTVVHQCGRATNVRSYLEELESMAATLHARQRNSYFVHEWLTVEELSWIYANAGVVVGRSGANTVQELAVFKIPSILVPLPFSHHQEQLRNAEWLASTGGAVVLLQKDLTADSLNTLLTHMGKTLAAHRRKLELLPDTSAQATEKLYAAIQALISKT